MGGRFRASRNVADSSGKNGGQPRIGCVKSKVKDMSLNDLSLNIPVAHIVHF